MQLSNEQTRAALSAVLEVTLGANAQRILQLMPHIENGKQIIGAILQGQLTLVSPPAPTP